MDYNFNILARYVHGSEDSTDMDVVYQVDVLPDKGICKKFCSEDENENRNMMVIRRGSVSEVYKGTPDEVNNSLFETYSLHDQNYPLNVKYRVERNKPIKYIRSLRIILSHLSRTQYRIRIKEALHSGWQKRLDLLKEIDLATIGYDTLYKNMTGRDIKKIIAFQIGQVLGLYEDMEFYTKRSIGEYYPMLKPYLDRTDISENLDGLNEMKDNYWNILFNRVNWEETGDTLVCFKDYGETYDLIEEKRMS